MNDLEQKKWHEKTFIRVLVLLLVPLIVGGLYFISTSIILNRPKPAPMSPETNSQ